ncbi:MAG: polysaccharide deacetylase family protein [Clostridia bacterium]|nr:polysaccharide deacetylase family protein [Clostridia bacterium]
MKKKILISALCYFLICSLIIMSVYAAPSDSLHWFIKRNKGGIPLFPPEADQVSEYNGYFIDSRVTEESKRIYLTFDAGYENGNVEKILNALKEENVPAAFFLLDNIILKNTDLVLRMADEGHLVCNHTKNHKNLCRSAKDEIERNLTALEKIYEEKTGRQMSPYFRFPEGAYSMDALKCVNDLGYKTIFWSFAYDDWDEGRQSSPEKALKKVIENTHNGAVMLFHPTSSTNAEIFPRLIKEWKAMGYSFGTLDELTLQN